MPFISFKTNIDLEETEIKNIEKAAGKYISKLDEKDESQLMISFESDIPMMFRGGRSVHDDSHGCFRRS